MKKKVIAALVLTIAIVGGLAAYAVGGSSGDPLVSLSYLTDTFLPSILSQANARASSAVATDYQAAQDKLDAARDAYSASAAKYTGDWTYSDLFQRQGYKLEDVVRFTPGSGFLFLEGSAAAKADGGELVDVTDGTSAASADVLVPGHRYLAGEGAVLSVTIRSDAAYLALQGYSSAELSDASALPFTDIKSTDWYYNYVHYVCAAALFNGVSETKFSPSASMTRAMLATVLYRLAGSPALADQTGSAFTDVTADSWYALPVSWAAASGIVNGMGDGLYMPSRNITREQMAVMLRRYAAFAGIPVDASSDLSGFSDAEKCSDWALEGVQWTVGAGIIGGRTDGTLDPDGTATRAEVAAMLQRFSALLK